MADSGRVTGSREPSPSFTGLGPPGFDPARDRWGVIDGAPCRVCGGDGWVCENHPDRAAFGDCCGGAGMPCGACALEQASAGFTSRERRMIVEYLRAEERLARIRRPRPDALCIAYANALSNAARAIEKGEHAIATETRRAETTKIGSVEDEGAGRKASPNTPNQGRTQP